MFQTRLVSFTATKSHRGLGQQQLYQETGLLGGSRLPAAVFKSYVD